MRWSYNQLADEALNEVIAARDITYVPDYVANAGGVIILTSRGFDRHELDYDSPEVMEQLVAMRKRTVEVLERAHSEKKPTSVIADKMAEEIFNAG